MKEVFREIFGDLNIKHKIFLIIFSILLGLFIYLVTNIKGYQDDNEIEETAEKIIENHLGVDIDLTPDTLESK